MNVVEVVGLAPAAGGNTLVVVSLADSRLEVTQPEEVVGCRVRLGKAYYLSVRHAPVFIIPS